MPICELSVLIEISFFQANVEDCWIGPIVQYENIGVNTVAGYFQNSLHVDLKPMALIKIRIA